MKTMDRMFLPAFFLFLSLSACSVASAADTGAALRQAAEKGDAATVLTLLTQHVDLEAKNTDGETALMLAAQNDHQAIVKALLSAGADVNAASSIHQSALLYAAGKGYPETVKLLLNKGADILAKDNSGYDPLLVSAYAVHPDVMQILLDKGGNVNDADAKDNTLLMISTAKNSPEAVRLLLERHADVNRTEKGGHSVLFAALKPDHDGVRALLKSAGAKPSVADTADLLNVAAAGRLDFLKQILAIGVDPNYKNAQGVMALTLAVLPTRTDSLALPLVQALVEGGADVNSADGNTMTPLMAASLCGKAATVRFLLEHHADPNVHLNSSGMTALMLAMMLAPFPQDDPLGTATALLKHGAEVNAQMSAGQTALVQALLSRNTVAARFLIAHGADVLLPDNDGETPLMNAAQAGMPDIVRLILARDHKPNRKDKQGRTALAWTHGPVVMQTLAIGSPSPNSSTPKSFSPLPGQPSPKDQEKETEIGRKEAAKLLKAAGGKE